MGDDHPFIFLFEYKGVILLNVFTLFGKIAIDNAGANKAIDQTNDKAGAMSSAFSKAASATGTAFSKIGSAAVAVGKTVAAGVAAGSAAVAGLTTAAVKSYAEYEQLVGGVETLLGARGAKSVEEYAAIVGSTVKNVAAEFEMLEKAQSLTMNNAANAYATAGLSANEYMTTATSLAAALNQSSASQLESAELADMAIIDMSDNANKMGTSMESIQNAYMGFSKQNYTMLDNLKLGYGGTKTEMQRLLKDAQAISGIKYDISSFSDIVSAIHVIQDEMGITGTTAAEASETISGSVAATKAAWTNLVTGLADENANIDQLVNNLVTSASTAAGNILPVIQTALTGAGTLVSTLVPQIFSALPSFVSGTLPNLIQSAVQTVLSVTNSLPGVVDSLAATLIQQSDLLIGSFGEIAMALIDALIAAAPSMMTAANTLLTKLISGLTQNVPQIMATATQIVTMLVSGLASAAPQLIVGAAAIIASFVNSLAENAGQIISTAADLIISLVDGLVAGLPMLIDAAVNLIITLALALTEPSMLSKLIDSGIDLIIALVDGILGALPQLVAAVPQIIENIVTTLVAKLPDIIDAGKDIVNKLIEGINEVVGEAGEAFGKIMSLLWDTAKEIDWIQLGKDIVKGILDGLQLAWESVVKWLSSAWAGLWGDKDIQLHAGSHTYTENFGAAMSMQLDGSHASGLDYVPYDGYIAELHKGEMVVPAEEAASLRSGSGGEMLGVLYQILSVLTAQNDNMGASMREAMEGVALSVNKREFGRLVSATGV